MERFIFLVLSAGGSNVQNLISYKSLQLPELNKQQIIVELEPRDTGPCVALTAIHFLKQNDDEVLVMAPSDQYISDEYALMEHLLVAEKIAREGTSIVTLGVIPNRPETGYGYIEGMKTGMNGMRC